MFHKKDWVLMTLFGISKHLFLYVDSGALENHKSFDQKSTILQSKFRNDSNFFRIPLEQLHCSGVNNHMAQKRRGIQIFWALYLVRGKNLWQLFILVRRQNNIYVSEQIFGDDVHLSNIFWNCILIFTTFVCILIFT